MKIIKLFMLIFIPLAVFAQDTVEINNTLSPVTDTLILRDTVYLTKVETTLVSVPDSLIPVKKDTLWLVDTIYRQAETKGDTLSSDFKTIEIIKDISLFTLFEIILLLFLGALLSKFLDKIKSAPAVQDSFKKLPLILAGIKIFIWIIIFYMLLSLFIVKTDEFIAALLLTGLILLGVSAIPFMRNLVGGLYISIAKPFEKGDYISVNNQSGEVSEIGWRSTIIITEGRSLLNIPNSIFLTETVENVNVGQKELLVSLYYEFPLSYDNQVIIKILRESAISSPYLFEKKEVSVMLEHTDFIRGTNKYKLSLYLFDSRFENEMIHSINQSILSAVNEKVNPEYKNE